MLSPLSGFLAVFSLSALCCAQSLVSPELDSKVDGLLKRMTLEEKVGQLVQYSAGMPTGPGTGRTGYREQVEKGQIGSLLNLTGAAETNAMQRIAMEKSRLKIPLLFGLDVIHGYRTIFPVPLAMASTWDVALVEQAARVAAQEASAEGVRWTFSPMVDIARDARWGRMVEGAGEDPYLGSAIASAYVRGYQGEKLDHPDSLAACAKHYVGYGAAEAGRDYNLADMSERTLREIYLPPFAAAVRAGAATVMSAFNSLNGVPASANPATLTGVLRREWGFPGFVVSDWESVGELIPLGVAADKAAAARKSLSAGVDMDMESGAYADSLATLVRSGALPEATVDEAVRRVLRVKYALGLFDRPYTPEVTPAPAKLSSAALALAATLAERSLVLLENNPVDGAPLLPLASPRSVALLGPFADNAVQMLGAWAGKGEAGSVTTLKSALEQRLRQSGGRLYYAQGTEIDTASETGFQEALNAVRQADVAILTLGEDALWMTAEAASRTRLGLPGNQQALLEAVVATGKPVVLIVFSGRPLALPWAAAHVAALLQAWYPGVQAGPALVRVLLGESNFSGKLTVSVPRSVGQEPLYYNVLNNGRPAGRTDLTRPPRTAAEKYVSRYIDEVNAPLFPFGYGLSYTQFAYSPPELAGVPASAQELNRGKSAVRVSATIANRGRRAGREIVQLYVGLRDTSVVRPVKELKGFRVLELAPGESQKVEFTLGQEQLAFFHPGTPTPGAPGAPRNIDMRYMVEPAMVTVWIAPSSDAGQPLQFRIGP